MSRSVAADASLRVQNDLTPGVLRVYRVSVKGAQTASAPRPQSAERVVFEQTGRLSLVVLDAADSGAAPQAWMMEFAESAVSSVVRDGEKATELPDARSAGLPPRQVQLIVADATATRAPAGIVGGSLVQRLAMLLALDFGHWPAGLIGPGESWTAPADRAELKGTWTHTYLRTEGQGDERTAVGEFRFVGEPTGSLAGAGRIEAVRGDWRWRVAARELRSSACTVDLSYGDSEQPRKLELSVGIELTSREPVKPERLQSARRDTVDLGKLASRLGNPQDAAAVADVERFVQDRSDSLWGPVARDLLDRARHDTRQYGELDGQGLAAVLIELLARWQQVAAQEQPEPLEPIRATYRDLVRTNRGNLYKLSLAEDVNLRTLAAFGIAFGDTSADLERVLVLCGDPDSRVRAWAAYGLAERRDSSVSAAVLERLVADADERVRVRACMAVETCVPLDSPNRGRFVELLLDLLGRDQSELVRTGAAKAVAALAKPSDLPALIAAEHRQDMPPARRTLEATIRRLGGQPQGTSDR